jgi:hypothetical protein
MPDSLKGIIEAIPFIGFVAGELKINTAQIIQYVIGAIVMAILANYIVVQRMEVAFEYMEKRTFERIESMEQDINDIRRDFYKPQVNGDG